MEIRSQTFCIYSSRLNHLSYKLIAWNLTSAVALASVFAVGAGADHALLDLGLVDEAASVARVGLQLHLDFLLLDRYFHSTRR